ncbi:unnamed protein product, partial [Owenia fusiformis]
VGSSTNSEINGLHGLHAVVEDKDIAARAVAFVVNSTRKGIVPLCADIATILRGRRGLEKKILQLAEENAVLRDRSGQISTSVRTSHSTSPTPPSLTSYSDRNSFPESSSEVKTQDNSRPCSRCSHCSSLKSPHSSKLTDSSRKNSGKMSPRSRQVSDSMASSTTSLQTVATNIHLSASHSPHSHLPNGIVTTAIVHNNPSPNGNNITPDYTQQQNRDYKTTECNNTECNNMECNSKECNNIKDYNDNKEIAEHATLCDRLENIDCHQGPEHYNGGLEQDPHCKGSRERKGKLPTMVSEPCHGIRKVSPMVPRFAKESQCDILKPTDPRLEEQLRESVKLNGSLAEELTAARKEIAALKCKLKEVEMHSLARHSTHQYYSVENECILVNGHTDIESDDSATILPTLQRHTPRVLNGESGKQMMQLNDHVVVRGDRTGKVRYIGHLENVGKSVNNSIFIGLELDAPVGRHDGILNGKRYFQCAQDHGVFVPIQDVVCLVEHRRQLPKKPSFSKDLRRVSSTDSENSIPRLHHPKYSSPRENSSTKEKSERIPHTHSHPRRKYKPNPMLDSLGDAMPEGYV